MKRLLHIIASPREEESRTLQVAKAFLDIFLQTHPGWVVDELDLGTEELPSMTAKQVGGKYVLLSGKDLYGRLKDAWLEILQHIDRFKTADLYLISTPMWNFSIPYMLKHYIDLIVQPKYLFRYMENGKTEGLIKEKKMVIAASSGGKYTKEAKAFDFQEPYLRAVFGFVGIKELVFIRAEAMDMGKDMQNKNLEEAKVDVARLARELDV